MRNTTWWVAGLLALSALGCAGGSAPTSTPTSNFDSSPIPSAASIGELGSLYQQGDLVQGAVAVYTLNVDPSTLSATSHLKAVRSAQANDDLYFLPIDGFFNSKSFAVTSVSATVNTIDVSYAVTHPFPAPNNPTGASNGSTNRSDLGVAGMVLILADAPAIGNTYFTDRVANTALVTNADAYFSPGGMISTTGLTANTFPYKQLVDESGSTGSRVGISNGGNPSGNFGTDGWTRAEYGTGNKGWTGMGVLHGGQSSTSTISLDKAALTGGFSLDIAVLAKYNDPRGGTTGAQKRGNRLPPATADATKFAYRGPHCALDVSKIEFVGESGGFIADNISSSTLSFRIEDFDARATESAQADLSLDPSFTNMAIGEAGVPDLAVSIPGVLGGATVSDDWDPGTDLDDDDSGFGGDVGQDSGAPGDGLFYSKTVSKGSGSLQPSGDITGLVRATDVEAAAPLWLVLDGNLAPATNPPVPVTYQAFTVNQLPGNLLPTGDWSFAPQTIVTGGTTNVTVTNVVDSDSATFDVQVDWGAGGGFVTVATAQVPGAGPFGPYASPAYNLAVPSVAEMKTLVVRLVDGVSAATNLATNVGGNTLTVNPVPPCTNPVTEGTQIFNADFSSVVGNNAWVSGASFPPVLNTDDASYSQFKSAATGFCNAFAAQTMLSGGMVNTGGDVGYTGCTVNGGDWINDYYTNVNNNVVSPAFATTGATAATIVFDSHKAGRFDATNVHFRVYYSTNNGVTWAPAVYDTTQTGAAAINEDEVNVVLPAGALNQASVRLRYEFVDLGGTFAFYFGNASVAGWAFDNVRVYTCP